MYNIMLVNYTLIIVVVVLLFVAYKHKDGFAGEPPINPNGETITQPIMLAIEKSTPQYKSFAGTLQNYCSYYDSGNNINTAINMSMQLKPLSEAYGRCNNEDKSRVN